MRRIVLGSAAVLFFVLQAKAEDRMTVNGVQYATTSGTTATACLTVKAIGDVEIAEKIKIKGKEYTTTEVLSQAFRETDRPRGWSSRT